MAKTPPRYDLRLQYGPDPDQVQDFSTSPYWFCCVWPLALPQSFERNNFRSRTRDARQAATLRGDPIVLGDQLGSFTRHGGKSQHLKQLELELKNVGLDWRRLILTGDWIGFWRLDHEDEARDVMERVRKGEEANRAEDGFCFLGRVESIRRRRVRDGRTGLLRAQYRLRAQGFRELEASTYYDAALAEVARGQALTWMSKLGIDIREVFVQNDRQQVRDNVHKIIPALLDALVGRGVPQQVNPGAAEGLPALTGAVTSRQDVFGPNLPGVGESGPEPPPYAYLVPAEVGAVLGKTPSGSIMSYADLLEMVVGVQDFRGAGSSDLGELFAPHTDGPAQRRYTGQPLLGAFRPVFPEISGRPIWELLQQFLNPAVNEMYTVMRLNREGRIVPQLVVRQIPLTTDQFPDGDLAVTRHSEVPRWVLHDVLVQDDDLGLDDATRVNFVHVYGQAEYTNKNLSLSWQVANNPPIVDEIDVYRSGLRPYATTVACDLANQAGKAPTDWMRLVADRTVGSQLTENGTVTVRGITLPIAEGDALELNGVLYHIEGVMDRGRLDQDGARSLMTILQVSHGVSLAEAPDGLVPYPGQGERDGQGVLPGATAELRDGRVALNQGVREQDPEAPAGATGTEAGDIFDPDSPDTWPAGGS